MLGDDRNDPHATLEAMPWWMFARERETVLVFQLSPEELAICGPGSKRATIHFNSAHELFRFRQKNANVLLAGGYRFAGFCVDRRTGDRRRTPRPLGLERRGA
jgi:hypothetical protein